MSQPHTWTHIGREHEEADFHSPSPPPICSPASLRGAASLSLCQLQETWRLARRHRVFWSSRISPWRLGCRLDSSALEPCLDDHKATLLSVGQYATHCCGSKCINDKIYAHYKVAGGQDPIHTSNSKRLVAALGLEKLRRGTRSVIIVIAQRSSVTESPPPETQLIVSKETWKVNDIGHNALCWHEMCIFSTIDGTSWQKGLLTYRAVVLGPVSYPFEHICQNSFRVGNLNEVGCSWHEGGIMTCMTAEMKIKTSHNLPGVALGAPARGL